MKETTRKQIEAMKAQTIGDAQHHKTERSESRRRLLRNRKIRVHS